MTSEDQKPIIERRSGEPSRSGQDRREGDRRSTQVQVDDDHRKGPTRSGNERRQADRRQG